MKTNIHLILACCCVLLWSACGSPDRQKTEDSTPADIVLEPDDESALNTDTLPVERINLQPQTRDSGQIDSLLLRVAGESGLLSCDAQKNAAWYTWFFDLLARDLQAPSFTNVMSLQALVFRLPDTDSTACFRLEFWQVSDSGKVADLAAAMEQSGTTRVHYKPPMNWWWKPGRGGLYFLSCETFEVESAPYQRVLALLE